MVDASLQSRSERERETYNEGISRPQYAGILDYSRHWFSKQRRARAADIFRMYDAPKVLELGSRTWLSCIERNGIVVDDLTCINISETELEKGAQMALNTGNKPKFEVRDAHDLEWDDASFDVIFGTSILHHLDFERALKEIRRLLKPHGTMFFYEPLDMNPVARIVRYMTPRARTDDERPFRMREFEILERYFDCSYAFEEMLSVPVGAAAALVGAPVDNPIGRGAYRVDRVVGRLPAVKYWCRTVFLEGRVPAR